MSNLALIHSLVPLGHKRNFGHRSALSGAVNHTGQISWAAFIVDHGSHLNMFPFRIRCRELSSFPHPPTPTHTHHSPPREVFPGIILCAGKRRKEMSFYFIILSRWDIDLHVLVWLFHQVPSSDYVL